MPTARIRIDFDDSGFKEILSSAAVAGVVMGEGEKIAGLAGDGFECKQYQTRGLRYDRPAAVVYTDTHAAMVAEATDKALTKAVQSCRR